MRSRFAYNSQRRFICGGLGVATDLLRRSGCKAIYLNGSFVTSKDEPGDFDACWDTAGVNEAQLHPIFLEFDNECEAQKLKFWGEFFPVNFAIEGGTSLLEIFQKEKFTGKPKGLLAINLGFEDDFE
jgi:hypothetical protein